MAQKREQLTLFAAAINLCNTSIGMGILSKPFALAISGWPGIISFAFAAAFVTYGGICLSDSVRELLMNNEETISQPFIDPPIKINSAEIVNVQIRQKSAYELISYRSLGKYGGAYSIIGFIILMSLINMTVIIIIFQLTQQISSSANFNIDSRIIYLCTFIIYIPSVLILNWKSMTYVAKLGVLSVLAILFTLIGLFILSFSRFGGPPPTSLLVENIQKNADNNFARDARKHMSAIEQYSFSFIIFMSGIAGNACVPKLTQSLPNKRDIVIVVTGSYIFISLFYSLIAVIGYWLYGDYTDVVIINNFYIWPGSGIVVISVSLLMILNLFSSFSIVLNLLSDVTESLFGINEKNKAYRRWFRMIILMCLFAAAYFLRKKLSFLVAITGVVAGLCGLALSLPFLIYIATFWSRPHRKLSLPSKIFHIILLVLAVSIGALTAVTDFMHVL